MALPTCVPEITTFDKIWSNKRAATAAAVVPIVSL